MTIALVTLFWPSWLLAQNDDVSEDESHAFDIGIIIDNRPLSLSDSIRPDVDKLFQALESHMYFDHILIFERPTIAVICDVFGCPKKIEDAYPQRSMIDLLTREEQSRIAVYYIGDGRIEGPERQLLFKRLEGSSDGDVVGFPVNWLHRKLKEPNPASVLLVLDTSFTPANLPCAHLHPKMIAADLERGRTAFNWIAPRSLGLSGTVELSATTAVLPSACRSPDQRPHDDDEAVFTKLFLEAIADGKADQKPHGDGDELIDVGEIAHFIDDRLDRLAFFRSGRGQHVLAIGPRSKTLASVVHWKQSEKNKDVLERLKKSAKTPAKETNLPAALPEEPMVEDRNTDCGDHSSADDCHPCVLEPAGKACAEHCQESDGSDLCAHGLIAGPDVDMDARALTSDQVGLSALDVDESNPADQRSTVCSFMGNHIAPFASGLVQLVNGGMVSSCAWANHRSEVERSPFAQIFTPIAWRLSRSTAQDAVSCLLDCAPIIAAPSASSPAADALDTPQSGEQQQGLVDPRTLDPLEREICDQLHEPLPPYIGIPRWMPGTLIISEALRAHYGCPPRAAELGLPLPPVVPFVVPNKPAPPLPADPEPSPPAPGGLDIVPVLPLNPGDPPPDIEPPLEGAFVDTASKVRWLQIAMTVDNRNPGPIDGVMGKKTWAAIETWRGDQADAPQSGPFKEVEFEEIMQALLQRLPHVEERIRPFFAP